MDVDIDLWESQAIVRDAVIAEIQGDGLRVDRVEYVNDVVRFGYTIIPTKARYVRDRAPGPNRARTVRYKHTYNRVSGRFVATYAYGQVNPRRVRVKGTCKLRP